ncbi:MAG: anti-sigma factor [Acidimicrobiales bacterium]
MTDDTLNLADDHSRIEAILRTMTVDDLEVDNPPTDLWHAIEALVGAEHHDADDDVIDHDADDDVIDHDADDNVIDAAARFRMRPAFLVAAAAALIVLVGVFVTSAVSESPDYEIVGGAELRWAEGFVDDGVDATAWASVLADGDADAIRLDQTTLPVAPDGEDLELWLIGVDSAGELTIQSVGVIDDPTDGRVYEVPAAFDPASFDTVLVDISFEPRDGNAAHSGASIVRGPVVEA